MDQDLRPEDSGHQDRAVEQRDPRHRAQDHQGKEAAADPQDKEEIHQDKEAEAGRQDRGRVRDHQGRELKAGRPVREAIRLGKAAEAGRQDKGVLGGEINLRGTNAISRGLDPHSREVDRELSPATATALLLVRPVIVAAPA